jgi:hypothetical protein
MRPVLVLESTLKAIKFSGVTVSRLQNSQTTRRFFQNSYGMPSAHFRNMSGFPASQKIQTKMRARLVPRIRYDTTQARQSAGYGTLGQWGNAV